MLRYFPILWIIVIVFPVIIGILILIPITFGKFFFIEWKQDVLPWQVFFDWPWIENSILLTLWTGLASTLFSLFFALLFSLAYVLKFYKKTHDIALLTAAPPIAVAVAVGFMIAPAGWISRVISPLLGWDTPPEALIAGDPMGYCLIFALIIKEIPFLSLAIINNLKQANIIKLWQTSASLGYGPITGWWKIIVPDLIIRLKYPLLIVLAFSISNADMAQLLLPPHHPTLAVLIIYWLQDANIQNYYLVACAGILVGALTVCSALFLSILWRIYNSLQTYWIVKGGRNDVDNTFFRILTWLPKIIIWHGIIGLIGMAIWSVAWHWTYPDILPSQFSLDYWQLSNLFEPIGNSLFIGVITVFITFCGSIAYLEAERNQKKSIIKLTNSIFLYIPLIVPMVTFLPGLLYFLIYFNLDNSMFAMIWGQLIFLAPYFFLIVSVPYRQHQPQHFASARLLGQNYFNSLIKVILPMNKPILFYGVAISFSVSIGLYFPNLLFSGGRIPTLVVHSMALASAYDFRALGVMVVMLTLLPVIVILFCNKRL